jgi:PKD repeat protein
MIAGNQPPRRPLAGATSRGDARQWSGVRTLAVLCLSAGLARAGIVDLSAPLGEATATYNGFEVVCRVFDPAQGKEFVNTTPAPSVFAFNNLHGVVSWTSGNTVFVRTYDPGQTNWVELNQPAVQTQDVRSHRGLVAWSATGQVGYTVYDRARRAWKTETVTAGTFDLRCVDGVVSWTTGNAVLLRTYDAGPGRWQKDDNLVGATFDLTSTNGVAVWSNGGFVRARVYDPLRQAWAREDTAFLGALSLLNDSGLVAWSNGSSLQARLFHPLTGQWLATTRTPPTLTAILMGITNATATWSDGFNVSQLGYNFAATNWHTQPTRPLAGFAVSTNAGRAPLTVYFTDLSVAALGRTWSFGDGGTSVARSPSYTFRALGRFAVTQTIQGTGGTSVTFTTNILTDLDPPAGTVVINDGAGFTTNHVVTLTLAASDNSGTVARMRFSNDGATWSAWEAFATNKVWELQPGVTTRTVHAQFEDPFGNASAVVTDSIFLDTTPPPPVRFAFLETNVFEQSLTLAFAVNLDYPMGREVRVDYATQALTATAGQDFEAAAGTLIYAPGSTNRVVTVRLFDDLAVELDEQFQIVLTNGVDTLPGAPLTVTILDNDPPAVRFATNRFSVREGDGQGVLTVALSAASGRPVSVAFATTNGTATVGLDYAAVTGVLDFAPGQTTRTIAVPILDDALDELTETIEVRLSSPTNAVLGTPATAVLDLLDNDPPTVNFSAAGYSASESAGSFTVTVGLSKPSAQTIFVDYATVGGTATPGQDYVAAAGTLIFSPGQTDRTFLITVLNDHAGELPETVELQLSGFVNVVPGDRAQATLTLLDDDALTLEALDYTAGTGFRLRAIGPPGGRVRLEFSADLWNWTTLTTLDNPDGTVEFTDPVPETATTRYYRARSLP